MIVKIFKSSLRQLKSWSSKRLEFITNYKPRKLFYKFSDNFARGTGGYKDIQYYFSSFKITSYLVNASQYVAD